jgi:hypothetical protein
VNTVKDILLSLLSEAEHKNYPVGKTQLVKYLYLVELDYFKDYKKRLTDLEWIFYHYGPYAFELESVLESKEFSVQVVLLPNERSYKRFAVAEAIPAYKDIVDTKVSLIIKRIVGQWGNKQLQELLDYVYFETEPMLTVERRGQVLDFSTVIKEPTPQVIPLKASKEAEKKIANLRKRFEKRLTELSELERTREKATEPYMQTLQAWAEEENPGFEGIEKIRITLTKPPQNSGAQGN